MTLTSAPTSLRRALWNERAGKSATSKNGVRLAQKMQVGPHIPVGIQLVL